MVKLQKPIPKKLGNKPKLDNPIKQKKQQLKKDTTSAVIKNTKVELLQNSTPIKNAQVLIKPAKEVISKKLTKKALNVEKESSKKPLKPDPESPQQKEALKSKKNEAVKIKNVVKNGTNKVAKFTEGSKKVKKVIPAEEPVISIKPSKPGKKVKAANLKEVPAFIKTAIPINNKAVPAPVKGVVPAKNVAPQKAVPQTKAVAPAKSVSKIKIKSADSPEKPAPSGLAKPGKKQKNKKLAVAAPESTPSIEKIKKVKKPKIQLHEKKKAKIAFKMAKVAGKDKPNKQKKVTIGTSLRYDPIPYDEEKFNSIVNTENIKKVAKALKKTVEKEVSTKKSSIFDDYRYFLQVGSFKIPSCPKRMVKLNLKHSLVDKEDDVLLVVPDLQRGAKVDYEPTKHHYEDMLQYHGIEGITVMPMNQLRKEFGTFEQKRRLCASYEYYMCDGRIVSHVGAIVGKLTQKPRNTFHAVRLNEGKDIKAEIEKSLKRTAFRQVAKSSLQTIPVGSHKFSANQLAENIELVVAQLKKIFPGGLGNIRNLYLRIGLTGTSSLPLFISMAQAPEATPAVIGPREERMVKLKREANEVLTKFAMTKEGKLIKLTKDGVEKKRKLQEMRAALKEDEEELANKAKKAKKESDKEEKKAKKGSDNKEKKVKKVSDKEANNVKEVKELELPENDEEEDEDSSDEDENVVQLGSGSEDETENEDNEHSDEEDGESVAEIIENGIVGQDEEDSEDEDDDAEDVNQSENDDDDEEEEEDDDAEESD